MRRDGSKTQNEKVDRDGEYFMGVGGKRKKNEVSREKG